MKDFIFNKLLPLNLNANGTILTLRKFNADFKKGHKLFYPSAGADTTDLVYVNNKVLAELKDNSPSIFIHSDYRISVNYLYKTDETLIYPNFTIKESFHLWGDSQKSITIFKLSNENNDLQIWLIYFSGYYNEEILKFLIKKQIKIDIVYAVCDGITHGMGGCNKFAIPTILYPLIAEHISLKYIITEQSYRFFVKKNLQYLNSTKRFRKWLDNINLIVTDETIRALLQLDHFNFIERLQQLLSDVPEKNINSYRKTRIYDHRYSHLLVLKQLIDIPDSSDDFFNKF